MTAPLSTYSTLATFGGEQDSPGGRLITCMSWSLAGSKTALVSARREAIGTGRSRAVNRGLAFASRMNIRLNYVLDSPSKTASLPAFIPMIASQSGPQSSGDQSSGC